MRMPSALLALTALMCTSCASGGGIFQAPKPSGIIEARLVGKDAVLSTSMTLPLVVNNGFSVQLREAGYNAQFTATIVSYTAATTSPCYSVAMDPNGTIATFTPRTATAINTTTTPNPCAPSSDVETVLFQDQQNHSLTLYYENE